MARLKETYKGKCLEDLKQFYELNPLVKTRKVDMLMKSGAKLIQEAEKNALDGDEEMAFIFYMKFLGIITHIQSLPNYIAQKQYINNMLGGKLQMNSILDKCQKLSESLKDRYHAQKQRASLSSIEDQIAMQQSMRDQIKTSGGEAHSEADRNKQRNERSSVSLHVSKRSMDYQELYESISNRATSILIMDCRPHHDYQESHMLTEFCFNVPEEILLPGMSAAKLQAELPEKGKRMWAMRSIKDHVVLMDWRNQNADPVRNSSLWCLLTILTCFDPDVSYKSLLILEGGFDKFRLHYPMLCTNPHYKPDHLHTNEDQTLALDGIEYPNVGDIVMKDTSFGLLPTSGPPGVDRNSKAAAIDRYDVKSRQVTEILEQQEQLAKQALANEQKRLTVETDWDDAHVQKEQVASPEEKINWEQLQKQYEYDLLQLANQQKDIASENESLREQLAFFKRKVQDNEKAQEEAQAMERTNKILQEKEQKRRQIDEQRALMEQERLKKLQQARDNKRHVSDDEPIERLAKMPQIDRTIKPNFAFVDCNQNVQRDFAAVPGCPNRGLTGLKNLGNTCYMNSIMQCLSNTTALVEYVIDDTYIRQVNRENKTKGRIIDEVAAVLKALWRGQYKFIASKDLRYVIGQYEQIFRGIEQQDSHEFLTILIDWLHSDLQTIPSNISNVKALPASEKAWQEYTKSKESIILQLFYGQIKSTVKCTFCLKESATYEPFSNLSLELPQNTNRCKIQECLGMYFNGEPIYGWDCPVCKQKRDAVKKLDISKLPPILVVHFKRFYADSDCISYRKKQNYVNFPLLDLDMAPYVAPSERKNLMQGRRNAFYNLYAVSNHYGSMESGHYTAFCKSAVAKKWYKFDDHMVSHIDQSSVESSAAYILFYSMLPEREPPPVRWP